VSGSNLEHWSVAVNGVRLHSVVAGDGPLVLLLHGFPDFWYGWRKQIPALAEAGFRVVAPDLRGYNLSEKPKGVRSYALRTLASDIAELVTASGAERAAVVGHDWGGGIAWAFAMAHPEKLSRLAILNAPHPERLLRALRTPRQLAKSWYMFFFQLRGLPERFLRAGGYRRLLQPMLDEARPGAFTDEDLARYREAYDQPGALSAMLAYYRAMFLRGVRVPLRPVEAPTMVVWGERDIHIGRELATPRADLVPDARVEFLPDASHWVQADEPDRVAALLVDHLRPLRA
jgi:pimeloyl-ACP methyl ester carboxylesterase